MGVEVRPWGEGGALLYTLTAESTSMSVTNWGASIVSFSIPDSRGVVADIVSGFDSVVPYMNGTSPYFGSIVGRVANRIADARFTLNGKTYNLSANEGTNTLHGGFVGFHKVMWNSKLEGLDTPAVEFSYKSFDGEQGFPGDVNVHVTYTLREMELKIDMQATPLNHATPINLAQHTYWNLGGHNSGDIFKHRIRIYGSKLTPVNESHIPTGEIIAVKDTAFDFLEERIIGDRFEEVGGYDHNYVLDASEKDGDLHLAASVREDTSGRAMDLFTSAPGMQFYTGNWMDGPKGKEDFIYKKHGGLCLETQAFPNAVNVSSFPDTIIQPGDTYKHVMLFKFHMS